MVLVERTLLFFVLLEIFEGLFSRVIGEFNLLDVIIVLLE